MSTTRNPGDTNTWSDVFVRDRLLGTTERVSVSSSGEQANGPSSTPAISGDGRYVAFASEATNLVAGDTNGNWDIFVRDRTGNGMRFALGRWRIVALARSQRGQQKGGQHTYNCNDD